MVYIKHLRSKGRIRAYLCESVTGEGKSRERLLRALSLEETAMHSTKNVFMFADRLSVEDIPGDRLLEPKRARVYLKLQSPECAWPWPINAMPSGRPAPPPGYVAGLLEAEGGSNLLSQKQGELPNRVKLSISNCVREPLDDVHAVLGRGSVKWTLHRTHHTGCYRYSVHCRPALKLLKPIYPFMATFKKELAKDCFDFGAAKFTSASTQSPQSRIAVQSVAWAHYKEVRDRALPLRLTPLEEQPSIIIPWLAGFLDGEGCINLPCRRAPRQASLRVSIDNKDRRPLDAVMESYGGTVRSDKERDCFRWTGGQRSGHNLLRDIYPYLRIKDLQAWLGICYATHRSLVGRKRATGNRGIDRACSQLLKDMHALDSGEGEGSAPTWRREIWLRRANIRRRAEALVAKMKLPSENSVPPPETGRFRPNAKFMLPPVPQHAEHPLAKSSHTSGARQLSIPTDILRKIGRKRHLNLDGDLHGCWRVENGKIFLDVFNGKPQIKSLKNKRQLPTLAPHKPPGMMEVDKHQSVLRE